jgi:hypothetical protein
MSDGESRTISIIFTKLNHLDRILRIREIEGIGGLTTGKKPQSEDELVGHLASVPLKNTGKWVSASDVPAMPAEEYIRRFDSIRLRVIENRQRELESRLERLEKMML